jgi:hypothetical protein
LGEKVLMYSSYALHFYNIVLLGFSVWDLSGIFFGWESNESRHENRRVASVVQWRESSGWHIA